MKRHRRWKTGQSFTLPNRRRNQKAIWFLAPSLCGVVVFILIPHVDVAIRSFHQAMDRGFSGLDNYRQVYESQAFHLAVRNTIRFLAACIPLLMVISLLMALLVNSLGQVRRGRKPQWSGEVFKTTIMIPMAIPVASIVLLWKLMFHQQGIFSRLLGLFSIESQNWMNSPWAFAILVATYIWKNTGYDMVLWLSGLSGIPDSLYEAAEVDGAGAFLKLCYITLPGLKPTMGLVLVLSVLNSFHVYREAYLIAGDYPNESIYMLQHLFNNWFVTLDIQKMSAASVMLETAVLVPALAWNAIKKRNV